MNVSYPGTARRDDIDLPQPSGAPLKGGWKNDWSSRPGWQAHNAGPQASPLSPSPTLPSPISTAGQPMRPKKLSVSQLMSQRQHGPNWSGMTDPATGQELSRQQAQARGPFTFTGWRTSGLARGGPIDAHVDGSTVAPTAAGAAPYRGLNALPAPSGGRVSSWDDAKARAGELPTRAYGGPVPPGQPFIAGDPQADGKPNPELIVPTPHGVEVVPLKGMPSRSLPALPQFAYGTVRTNDFPEGEHRRDLIPGSYLSRATSLHPGRDGPETPAEMDRIAYDPHGKIVGFSSGITPIASDAPPPTATSIQPSGGGWTREDLAAQARHQFQIGNIDETEANIGINKAKAAYDPAGIEEARAYLSGEWQAQQKRNPRPEGASQFPGVAHYAKNQEWIKPREHLAPNWSTPAPLDADDREKRQYERIQRDVLRAARTDPRLGFYVSQAQKREEQDKLDREAAIARAQAEGQRAFQEQQAKINAARGLVEVAPGTLVPTFAAQQSMETAQRLADQAGLDANARNLAMSKDLLGIAQSQQPPGFVPVPGSNGGVIMQGNKLASGYIPIPMTGGPQQVAPGANLWRNPDHPDVDLEQTSPGIPTFQVGKLPMPGKVPSFKPMTKAGAVEKPKKINRAAILDEIEKAEEIMARSTSSPFLKAQAQRVLNLAKQDLDGDGIPDSQQGAGAARPSSPVAPSPTNPNASYFE